MAQRGSTSKPTRFKGPTVVTLRGAGASGNDPLVKGAGSDIGLDVQVPIAQTANCFQITKPDGTILYQVGPAGDRPPVNVTASGAIPVRPGFDYVITKAGVAAMTLAAPTAGTDDGTTHTISSASAFAHTITATGLFQTGTASVNTVTFPAFAGGCVTVKAYNGKWLIESGNGVSLS